MHLALISGASSNGRFRNFSSRLTGEQFLDELGLVLGRFHDHWWTVHEEGTKSIPLDYFLQFENEWFALVSAWLKKHT